MRAKHLKRRGPGRPRGRLIDGDHYGYDPEGPLEPLGARRNDAQLVMRMPKEMHERLKRCAVVLSRDFARSVTLAATARMMIDAGLTAAGFAAKETP